MAYSQSPPLADEEWLTAEEMSSGGRARDLHAPSDQRIAQEPKRPFMRSRHSASVKDQWPASKRPSIGRRIFRALSRFFIAVLIGVGATLAWQSYGDVAREMTVTRIPLLASVFPVAATEQPVVAVTQPASAQQIESLGSNLDGVRRSVEQLAAKQEQLAQNIAALQAVEQDIREKMSSTPPSSPQPSAPMPQQKSPQPKAQPSASSLPRPSSPGPLMLQR